MSNLKKLKEAIEKRTPISYEYNKDGKVHGVRYGNPHALFIFTSKAGIKSTKLHLVQTGGVSDSVTENPFPDFRMFNIEDLSNIELINSEKPFGVFIEKYNPEWEGYKNVIAKV